MPNAASAGCGSDLCALRHCSLATVCESDSAGRERGGAPGPPCLGAPLPRTMPNLECGVVSDGKLFAIRNDDQVMFVYEPQTDTWTEEEFPWDSHVGRACSHNGRVVVFLKDGTSFERLSRDEWQPYDVVGEVGDIAHDANTYPNTYVAESVLLG